VRHNQGIKLSKRNTYSVILLGGGSSRRLGSEVNKVLLPIEKNGRLMIDCSLKVFLEDQNCTQVLLVIRKEEQQIFNQWIEENHRVHANKIQYVQGGGSRQESVENGVSSLNSEAKYVMIHDGARPLISKELVDTVFTKVQEKDAVTLAVPSQDTINRVIDGQAVETLDRSEVWKIQTPQAFKLSLLNRAIEKAHSDHLLVNEEGQLFIHMNYPVHIILGSKQNIKVTTKEDLEITKAIIQYKTSQ